jgi:hypothetical protein
MGMFDYVVCDYKLPLSETELSQLKTKVDWENMEFQTKSFVEWSSLEHFSIEEDGQLYKKVVEYEENDDREVDGDFPFTPPLKAVERGIERVDYTGEISFYNMIIDEDEDFWVEFKALFWKGDLKEIHLEDFKKEDNSARVEFSEQMQAKIDSMKNLEKKWWYSIYRIWAFFVKLFLGVIRYLVGWIAKICWKLERWLT